MPMSKEIQTGQCVRISTGAPVPAGADAVVQIEDTVQLSLSEDKTKELEIEIIFAPKVGQDIRPIGSDIEAHSVIIKKGIVLNSAEIGVLAAVGKINVKVYKRPTIAVISTGNELQDPSEPLKFGHIRDSNKITILSILKQYGYQGEDLGLAKDEPNSVKRILEQAFAKCDVIITTGGVSMGEYDVIKRVLETDFNAKIHFGRVNMKPGKPTTFATCLYNDKIKTIFGLPGNPVSATVTCLLFIIPMLRHCENRINILYPKVEVDLDFTPQFDPDRPEYHRVHLKYGGSSIMAQSTGNQISSRLNSFVGADGLLILPAKKDLYTPINKEIKNEETEETLKIQNNIGLNQQKISLFGQASNPNLFGENSGSPTGLNSSLFGTNHSFSFNSHSPTTNQNSLGFGQRRSPTFSQNNSCKIGQNSKYTGESSSTIFGPAVGLTSPKINVQNNLLFNQENTDENKAKKSVHKIIKITDDEIQKPVVAVNPHESSAAFNFKFTPKNKYSCYLLDKF